MSVISDVVNLTLNINGNAAQNKLNELRKTAADLTNEMKNNLKKGTDEYIAAAAKLKNVKADMTELKQTIGLTALSMRELASERKKYENLVLSSTPLSKEWKDYGKELQAVIARQDELKGNLNGYSSTLGNVKQGISSVVAGYLGFFAIIGGVKSLVSGTIKLSDQLGDLRRVAGLTADEANNLNHALLGIDTRTSGAGLLSIAIIAGKLGVAKNDIFSFTQAVDKLVVTLGDELGGADEITTQLGKILNVFDGKVTGDNISYLGNAIVDLANKGVATGGFIVDFTQRVSGIAKAANISLGATVGLAAGFESLGLRSESSSTALQKLLLNISQDTPKAAKIAGIPLKEFNQLFADKPQEALLRYAEGLVKNKQAFSDITTSFKDAGESGARVVQTILAIGQNADYMRSQIDQGNKSIKEQSALNEGFAIKNENLAGSVERLGKTWDRLIANNNIMSFFQGIINVVSGAVEGVNKLADSFDSLDTQRQKALKKQDADQNAIAEQVAVGFTEKTIDEQQKLADSYKEIYISSRKALAEYVNSGGSATQEWKKMVLKVEQDGKIFIATQKKLKESLTNLNKKEPSANPLIDPTSNTNTKNEKGSSSAENSEHKRLLKEAQAFYTSLQQLKEDAAVADKSQDEKDLVNLQQKYNEFHAKALEYFKKNITDRKTYTEEEKLIVAAFNNDLAALQKKQFDSLSADEYAQSLKISDDYFAAKKRDTERQYAEGKVSKEDYENSLTTIEILEVKNRVTISKDYSATVKKAAEDVKKFTIDQETQITKNLEKQKELREAIIIDEAKALRDISDIKINDPKTAPKTKANLEKKNAADDRDSDLAALKQRLKAAGFAYDDATINATAKGQAIWAKYYEAIKNADDELLQKKLDNFDQYKDAVLNITGNLITALNNLDQRALQKDKKANDAKIANYKKQLDHKLISQKQYDVKVAAAQDEMDKKKAELDLKAFKRQQALAIVGALINGAEAVTATLAARPGLTDIATFGILRAIQVGLVIAATAAQIAAISSQAPPEAAEGNWFRTGDKHSDPSGGIPVMIERDEAVMKADAMTDRNQYTVSGTPSQITSKLNSLHGGVNWESGAQISLPKFREAAPRINPNMPRIMARGGSLRESGNQSSDFSYLAGDIKRLADSNDQIIEEIKNQKARLHAVVSIREFRRTEKIYLAAKKASGLSQ